MLDFIVTYFATYDITTEVVVLILAFALLVIIILSRPERNHMMRLLIVGLSLSMVTIISHIIMLGQTLTMRKTHSYFGFNLWYDNAWNVFLYTI